MCVLNLVLNLVHLVLLHTLCRLRMLAHINRLKVLMVRAGACCISKRAWFEFGFERCFVSHCCRRGPQPINTVSLVIGKFYVHVKILCENSITNKIVIEREKNRCYVYGYTLVLFPIRIPTYVLKHNVELLILHLYCTGQHIPNLNLFFANFRFCK